MRATKGHLDLLLLSALDGGSAHGYHLIERIAERSLGAFELKEGTVYPALHQLEADGFLKSRWETISGRRRRVYRLTRAGRKQLDTRRDAWDAFSGAINAVIGGIA